MPPPSQRKVPFSAKQKKEQLKSKRERKKNEVRDEFGMVVDRRRNRQLAKASATAASYKGQTDSSDSEEVPEGIEKVQIKKINQQPDSGKGPKNYDPNKYRLHFKSDSNENVEKGKALSLKPIPILPEEACEIDLDDIYKPGSVLDLPKRPAWDYSMSRQALDAREEQYFKGYLDEIFENYKGQEMSYFELNLETWRQLWRVIEMSDVILLITDIRHPALHFSPALYDFVIKDLKKHLILVLNKIDLAPPSLVVAWKHYFQKRFPELTIVCFTSLPKCQAERDVLNTDPSQTLQKKRRKRAFSTAVGPKQLLQACEKISHGVVDLSSWKDKIEEDIAGGDDFEETLEPAVHVEELDTAFQQHQLFTDRVLTIGCCGYPNVGKSSLINGLVGKKVVSVSKTPGHTKHFQTIFLTQSVKLCDSPGLVFPSLVCRPLQILSGIFPISQLREPYTTVRYLAERIPLAQILKLKHPDSVDDKVKTDHKWSAYNICDAWAEKRGFLTAKAARSDVYRAANHILRMASEGRICMCMRPPKFTAHKEMWEKHPESEEILRLQEMHRMATHFSEEEDDLGESSNEEDGDDEDDDEEDSDGTTTTSNNPFALLSDD